jgi:hypothetical protein
MGSFLPNDHGGGNRGGCGCSRENAGAQVRPIFKRVDRGLYQVIDYSSPPFGASTQSSEASGLVIVGSVQRSSSLTASGWLLGHASSQINRLLGRDEPARVLAGQKGGKWVAVGKKLPFHELTRGYRDTWWAIGIDRQSMDYELGESPKKEPMYLGMRCDRNVSTLDGEKIYNTLSEVLPGSWKEPDRYWPIWTVPDATDEDGHALTREDYIDAVIAKYVATYSIILEQLEKP